MMNKKKIKNIKKTIKYKMFLKIKMILINLEFLMTIKKKNKIKVQVIIVNWARIADHI